MSKEAMKLALEAAYLAGFKASGEGYNGEYPFQDHNAHPAQDEGWCQNRDAYIRETLAEQPAQQEPVAIALNTGTKQGVKWLKNVEHGESLYTTPQPAQQEPVAIVQSRLVRIGNSRWRQRKYIVGLDGKFVSMAQLNVGDKLYTSPQAHPAQRKPLPYNKDDMEGLDINQRLGFKLGWKAAEEAHGIKEKS